MRVISPIQLNKIAVFTAVFSDGSFVYKRPGGDVGQGQVYYEGTLQKVWYGNAGGRTLFAAYVIGYALGWAKKSGKAISASMRESMVEIQCSYARRYEAAAQLAELDGRAEAERRWERANVLRVTNREGIDFNVVLTKDDERGRLALGLWVIKVYDTRYDHTEYGQFTGGSAYAAPLIGVGGYGEGLGWGGWNLSGGEDSWKLSGSNAVNIRCWLERHARQAGL